jgi:hypothetical protein
MGNLLAETRIKGTAAAPVLTGSLKFQGVPAMGGPLSLTVDDATVTWRDGFPGDPSLDLHATGLMGGFPFGAYVVGPLSHRIAFIDSEAARTAMLGEEKPAAALLPPPGAPALTAASAPAAPAAPAGAAPKPAAAAVPAAKNP